MPVAANAKHSLERVLFIESGPRLEGEKALAALYSLGVDRLDLLTCFEDPPQSFDATRGTLLSVHSPQARADRNAFIRELCAGPYTSIVVLWVGSGVLRNWTLAIGARSFKRLLLLDRDGELARMRGSFGKALLKTVTKPLAPIQNASVELDWDVSDSILSRAGEVALAPFQLGYLILFTARMHAIRFLRMLFRQVPHS